MEFTQCETKSITLTEKTIIIFLHLNLKCEINLQFSMCKTMRFFGISKYQKKKLNQQVNVVVSLPYS
jgi:hypothetical protein